MSETNKNAFQAGQTAGKAEVLLFLSLTELLNWKKIVEAITLWKQLKLDHY